MRLSARDLCVVEALLPPARSAGFESFYADFEKTAPFALRLGVSVAFIAGYWVAPLFVRRWPPLSRLDGAQREAALEAMGRCRVYPLRKLFWLSKTFLSFFYGSDAGLRRRIGFPSTV